MQRLILPLEPTPDIIPLYVEQEAARTASAESAAGLRGEQDSRRPSEGGAQDAKVTVAPKGVDVDEVEDRLGLTIPGHSMRSFGTYFNAFPAAYWRRWTPVREVRLSITTSGPGRIIVYRSNARGANQRHEVVSVSGEATTVLTLPVKAFGDGGWYWFDAYAGSESLQVIGAEWTADADLAREDGLISLAMTTMNKVEYCLENIATIAGSADLRKVMDTLYVVDQGTDRLADHPEQLRPLQDELGDQLTLIEQGNIGGSGGFSRGMYETAQAGRSAYVVTCDDDIVLEPETLIRLKTFADFATSPMLVGAHMFDLNNRSVLHSFGEKVDQWRTVFALAQEDGEMSHDFSYGSLRTTPWLHRRADVDYNGWWMCLIPVQVLKEIGLSLPVFIKWDDSEYGLRAKKAGYPTVSLPGAGVWHVSWSDKDDALDWQAYFHERNRLITALLHSPYPRGGRIVRESAFGDIKHTISMQYYTETARLLAQKDVMEGPEGLHAQIGTKLPEIRALAQRFEDAQGDADAAAFPPVSIQKPPNKGRPLQEPRRARLPLWTATSLVKQLAVAPRESARRNPEAAVAQQDARWWRLAKYDSALVSNAEGTRVSWYRRDPGEARALLAEAARTHLDLYRRWPELQERFRSAARDLTSFESWERTFRDNPAPERSSDPAKPAAGSPSK
nr:glycosyltransferase [Brachybacterium equifaecis]